MNYLASVVLILSTMLNAHCQKKNDADASKIINCWMHSYEEENSEYKIFRPCDQEFPPARFRRVIEFKSDNKASWLHLAPNDAHYMKEGSWEYDEEKGIIEIKDEQGEIVWNIKVVDLKDDLLKIDFLKDE